MQWVNGTGTKWPGTAFYEEETAQELHFSGLNVIDTEWLASMDIDLQSYLCFLLASLS